MSTFSATWMNITFSLIPTLTRKEKATTINIQTGHCHCHQAPENHTIMQQSDRNRTGNNLLLGYEDLLNQRTRSSQQNAICQSD